MSKYLLFLYGVSQPNALSSDRADSSEHNTQNIDRIVGLNPSTRDGAAWI